jgi:hypothetical protein
LKAKFDEVERKKPNEIVNPSESYKKKETDYKLFLLLLLKNSWEIYKHLYYDSQQNLKIVGNLISKREL